MEQFGLSAARPLQNFRLRLIRLIALQPAPGHAGQNHSQGCRIAGRGHARLRVWRGQERQFGSRFCRIKIAVGPDGMPLVGRESLRIDRRIGGRARRNGHIRLTNEHRASSGTWIIKIDTLLPDRALRRLARGHAERNRGIERVVGRGVGGRGRVDLGQRQRSGRRERISCCARHGGCHRLRGGVALQVERAVDQRIERQ